MELIGKTKIDFIGMKKISFIISGIISIIGIIGIIQIGRGAANMGIDFSGGTSVQLKFSQPIAIEQARAALAKHNLAEANLQEIKDGNKLLVKVGKTTLATGKAADTI
ncbi:MAG TPA: protein translocase subunit SecF, partial [Geomobilimonas sp.]|nr:protein translocase subunit SecF [Geomobilimonas sp.]